MMSESSTLPSVTVVIPTRGRPELLRNQLDSLTGQTYPASRLEVIVMHNFGDKVLSERDFHGGGGAPEDNTESVVNEYARKAPFPVRYIRVNFYGRNPSRRLGSNEASGNIVVFTDDDCVAAPEWIASGVACFTPSTGVVQGRTLPNPDQRRRLFEKTIEITEKTGFYETCNIFYRKEALVEPDAFGEDPIYFGEDTVLAYNVKKRGYTSAFSEDAVVYHEVFATTFFEWLLAPAIGARGMGALPQLVHRVPALREHMFLRYFLHLRTALFDLLLLGLLLGALLHPLCLLLAIPYFAYRYYDPCRFKNPLMRIARILFGVPRACVLFAALAIGSLRSRSLLL